MYFRIGRWGEESDEIKNVRKKKGKFVPKREEKGERETPYMLLERGDGVVVKID